MTTSRLQSFYGPKVPFITQKQALIIHDDENSPLLIVRMNPVTGEIVFK